MVLADTLLNHCGADLEHAQPYIDSYRMYCRGYQRVISILLCLSYYYYFFFQRSGGIIKRFAKTRFVGYGCVSLGRQMNSVSTGVGVLLQCDVTYILL